MTLASKYPYLEKFCTNQGFDLDAASRPLTQNDEFLDLAACWAHVKSRRISSSPNAADEFGYLATVEEFLSTFQVFDKKKLLDKMTKAKLTATEFLDTISELSLAIEYAKAGQKIEIEKLFDPINKSGKDSDLFLDLGTTGIWIDVKSILPTQKNLDEKSVHPFHSEQSVIDLFRNRIKEKYFSKFHSALEAKLLSPPSAGIALCLLKCEDMLLSLPLYIMQGQLVDLGPELWQQCPYLTHSTVYTLRKIQGSQVLAPVIVSNMIRPNQ